MDEGDLDGDDEDARDGFCFGMDESESDGEDVMLEMVFLIDLMRVNQSFLSPRWGQFSKFNWNNTPE